MNYRVYVRIGNTVLEDGVYTGDRFKTVMNCLNDITEGFIDRGDEVVIKVTTTKEKALTREQCIQEDLKRIADILSKALS